jgi:hypothetical protein
MKAKSEKSMRHRLPEVQDIIDYEFLNQKLDDYVKLDILFYELDRLDKTVKIRGTPFVFLDPEEADITTNDGKRIFAGHMEWIGQRLMDNASALSVPEDGERLDDLFNSLIDILWKEDLHPMIILTLAQIVIVQGLERYHEQDN